MSQKELGAMLERIEKDEMEQFKTPTNCFLIPNGPDTGGVYHVIVAQDEPKSVSKLIVTPQKAKVRPTTGRVIATIAGQAEYWKGKRVVFSPMSGCALRFKNRPAWIAMSMAEIVAEVAAEDAEIDQDSALPLDGSYS